MGRLSSVNNVIMVMSGKGGVGKSTVAVQLANALVAQGFKVGLLDVDLTGPSVPRLVGLRDHSVHKASDGLAPVYTDATKKLAVMSIGFLLKNETDPIIWRGPKKNAVIKQFLQDVIWDELDYLIIDTPPGTSDEHISTCEFLVADTVSPKAIIVTTPQSVALADVRREIAFCKKLNIDILGIVENMSGYICQHCAECTNIFSSDGGRLLAEELQLPFIGTIPIDQKLTACEDAGENFFAKHGDSSTLQALTDFVSNLKRLQSEMETEAQR